MVAAFLPISQAGRVTGMIRTREGWGRFRNIICLPIKCLKEKYCLFNFATAGLYRTLGSFQSFFPFGELSDY
jgi:hypothetical protein